MTIETFAPIAEAAGFTLSIDLVPEGCQLWTKGNMELHLSRGFWGLSDNLFSGDYPCGTTEASLAQALAA